MRKKGFTLIELLAVIIILAVIALVATPAIITVIEDAQNEANRQSVNGLIDAARTYYAESLLDENKKENVDNVANIYNAVSVTGKIPETGYLAVNKENQVAVSVTIGKKCYIKHFATGLQEYEITDENCNAFVGEDYEAPEITFEINGVLGNNNWYKHNEESEEQIVKVTIKVEDSKSGIKKYKYCEGIDCTPSIEVTTSGQIVEISDTPGTKVCVEAEDKNGNIRKECSNIIKVDTVLPSFSGINDMVVEINEKVDLEAGVMVDEGKLEYTYTPVEVDTKEAGTKEVIYTAVDEAGNIKTVTRKINVANAPTITFTAESGAINENGWAKSDFYVTLEVSDNSGNGIKSFNVCTATTDTCDPSVGSEITGTASATRLISTENNNNRICVQATDNNNLTSPVICGDAYKLDKTVPTAGTILVNGSESSTNWYGTDVTIEAVAGTDSLSGHESTETNITSIKENTEETVVIVTTKDKAGNESTRNYTIKVDKTQPTCTFTTLSYVGVNKTATIELTCTNTMSGMSDKVLAANDFTTSNSNVSITSVSKTKVTNGYKYTITVKGVAAGSSTITLPAGKVSTVAGLSNEAKPSESITVTSVSLNTVSGTGYVGGSNLTATITSSNAGTISCTSSNTSIATCSISGSTLTIVPKAAGVATITVTGTNGSPTAIYTATSKVVTLGLSETNGTLYAGGTTSITTTIQGSNYGSLSCVSSNTNLMTCSISGTTLTIKQSSNAQSGMSGTATITVSETNIGKNVTYTITNKYVAMFFSDGLGGGSNILNETTAIDDGNITLTIGGSNYGTLSCISNDTNVATCSISGTTLTIVPKAAGVATITVTESNVNKTITYNLTVEDNLVTLNCSIYYSYASNYCPTSSGTVQVTGQVYCSAYAAKAASDAGTSCGSSCTSNCDSICTEANTNAGNQAWADCCSVHDCE